MPASPLKAAIVGAVVWAPLVGFAQAPPPGPQPILPGYWSYTTSTILPGSSDGNQCVRPDKIDEFLSGPHNRHYKCVYPSKHVGEGRAFFDGECVGHHGERYKISVAGTYSQSRFTLKGRVQGKLLGLPLSSPISIDARWIGSECPPGSK